MTYCVQLILLFMIPPSTCKGQDVVLTTTPTCCNVNGGLTFEAEYKGSGTVAYVIWTVTGGATSLVIDATSCSSPFHIPSGFPDGKMSYDCSFAPKYLLTVESLETGDLNKTWEVDFSISSGSTYSGTQQQTVTQCETFNESNTGFPRWAIGLIVLVIGVVAAIIYGVYRQSQCLKDPPDEEHMSATNEAKKDNGKEIGSKPPDKSDGRFMRKAVKKLFPHKLFQRESDNNCVKKFKNNKGDSAMEFDEENHNEEISNGDSAMEFDEENHNEENSNGDVLHEERRRLTNEAIRYYIRPMNKIDLLNEERRPLTNEANENIQQRNKINHPDKSYWRFIRKGAKTKFRHQLFRRESDNKPVDQSLSFPSIKDIIRAPEERCNNPTDEPTNEPTGEPNTRLTSLGAHVEIEDIRHESDNNKDKTNSAMHTLKNKAALYKH